MTAELGAILGLNAFVVLSVVGLAWCVAWVEGKLVGVGRSVERLKDNMVGLREDLKTVLLRSSAEAE